MAASTILRLARDFDNIAAVKEASDNFIQIAELLEERPDNFSVLTGEDSLILPFIAMGGEELGDGILIVQLRMGRDELAVGGGKDDGLWTRR